MSAPTLDRTWSEEAGGVHVEVPAADFTVDLIRGATVETVVVRGDLDIATAPLLGSVLDSVRISRGHRLDIDLSAVSFLDAYALATLVRAGRRLSTRGVEVVLRDPSPIVRRVLELTGVGRVVTVSSGEAA